MCLYPKLITNRKYVANKKNGGIIPPLPLKEINGKLIEDKRVLEVPVGCGKCIECMNQRRRNWQVRLLEEVKHNRKGIFVTLTFSDESIRELGNEIVGLKGYDRDNAIVKLGVRRFLERWRKKYGKSVRHWFVSELGHRGTENVHIHGIVWTDKKGEDIRERWGYGFVWSGDENKGWVNEQTINYISKYINKVDEKNKYYKAVILTSAGIGKGFLKNDDRYKAKKNEVYTNRQGYKMNLPIYYRNYLYSDKEKEDLWIKKLDENLRWVCGEKIDISKGEKAYNEIRKWYRAKNKRLGYGDDEVNWELKKYEEERRNIRYWERVKRAVARENIEIWKDADGIRHVRGNT